MSKSLWSIVVLGFVTIVIMVFMMLASLTMFKATPAAQRAKLSNVLRERFGFPEVAARVRDVKGDLVLQVEYVSTMESGFSDEKMDQELSRVAEFARRGYDGKDRRHIRRLSLKRTEIQGSGCWTRTLEREMNVEHPFLIALPEEEATEDPSPKEEGEEK